MESATSYARKITIIGIPGYDAGVPEVWKKAYEGMVAGSPFLISTIGANSQLDCEDEEYGTIHIESAPVLIFGVKTMLSPMLCRYGEESLIIPVARFSKLAHGEFSMKEKPLRLSLADFSSTDGVSMVRGIFGAEAIRQWISDEAVTMGSKESSIYWNELVVKLVRLAAAVGYDFLFPEFIIAVKGQRSAECIKRLAKIATQTLTPELRTESHALIAELKNMGVSEGDCKKYIKLELERMRHKP